QAKFHAQLLDMSDLRERVCLGHLIFGHSERIEPSRLFPTLVDRHIVTKASEIRCARKSRRTRADHADRLANRRAFFKHRFSAGENVLSCNPLQTSYLDRLINQGLLDTGSLAEHLDGADLGTGRSDRIGVKDHPCRAREISACDLLDKPRNIDVRWAGSGA